MRPFSSAFIRVVWMALVLVTGGSLPLMAQDVVRFTVQARGAGERDLAGVIEKESAAGIQLKTREKAVLIPATDIVLVQYKHPELLGVDFRAARDRISQALVATGASLPEKVKQGRDAADKLAEKAGSSIPVARYATWQVALSRFAEAKAFNKDAEAVSILDRAATATRGGWEEVQALQLLVEEQLLQGQSPVAALDRWSKVPGLPKDAQAKVMNRVRLAKLREGKSAEVSKELSGRPSAEPGEASLLALAQLISGPMDAVRLKKARAALANLVAQSVQNPDGTDPALEAGCLTLLGSYLVGQKKPDEAVWEFVRVEAQYPQEKPEMAEALYHLATLYDSVLKNPRRAEECAERLKNREYSGSVWLKK
jgi:hypothetical protein